MTELSRWQFATTSIYHFLFVPVTIGLAFLVALLQTAWHRSLRWGGDPVYRRLTRFFGTLLLINVAIGVVTGLIQEFEFGMNWSAYSRFVGDVFGGPLAMEGLAAFFLESTFLGLWIFGWNRLPRRIHLACIWMVSLGTILSAMFIMAANSWMQHPVGYTINPQTHQAQLTDIWALFTNPVFYWGYLHVIMASIVTGALVMLAVSAWHLRKRHQVHAFRKTATLSLVVLLPAAALVMFFGGRLGINETKYQPMKIAAAEGQWNTCQPCSFSAFQIGGGNNDQNPDLIIPIPHLLSILATGTWNGKVEGMNQVQAQYVKQYGPGSYVPIVFIQYWGMRVMAYLGALIFLFALWGAYLGIRRRLDRSKWFQRAAIYAVVAPFLMTTAGWLLTENGRQPWIVQGLMRTTQGVSPSVSSTEVWISLIAFASIYIVLGAADAYLMIRYGRKALEEEPEAEDAREEKQPEGPDVPAIVY
jgi:cytochrome d ubiquinol oxidase subunit I